MNIKTLVLSAALAAAPFMAGAVTVSGAFGLDTLVAPGDVVGGNVSSTAGDGFTRSAAKLTAASAVSVSGTGTINGLSGFTAPVNVGFSTDGLTFSDLFTIVPAGDTASYDIPALALGPGEMIYILAEYAGASQDNADIDFRARVAPVPLPAAGWLLAASLAGVGFLSRKRRAAARRA